MSSAEPPSGASHAYALADPGQISGRSIIGGFEIGDGDSFFRAFDPARGIELEPGFHAATPAEIERACRGAYEAFTLRRGTTLDDKPPSIQRSAMLEQAAANIAALGDDLIDRCVSETGLPPARLVSERERTVLQLRMFASVVRQGSWVRAAIDHGDANRRPLPRPDLRRMLRPLGPVAVFGAGNFPLAYSAAGTDAASALAAGCPVIVKGHPAHPGTGELVARAVSRAVAWAGLHPGTYSYLLAGGAREQAVGRELVTHPCVRAVGFTGSPAGGMALAALGASRVIAGVSDPIPVFAEMGSVNPIFILPGAMAVQTETLAERLASSATASVGQMCTCPGLIFVMRTDGVIALERALTDAFARAQAAPMLSFRIASNYAQRCSELLAIPGVELCSGSSPEPVEPGRPLRMRPALLRTTYETFRRNIALREECFGPSTILVVCNGEDDLLEAAGMIQGSLTGSIFAGGLDAALALQIQTTLEQRVGRLIFNGVPTGVEVVGSTVHGGPFPATNQPNSTAVGPLAIERWCRPVSYQNAPESMLPPELRDENPLGISRHVDGVLELPD
jgi:NADP-dependent aldehyde dehydrogenase